MSKLSSATLTIFRELSRIPRPSKKEERIRKWLLERAAKDGFESETDDSGNLVIRVPGRGAGAKAPTVVLQGHMDMVGEKTPDSNHDFETDPIEPVEEGEWLRAVDTTLGADNGIAMAIGLATAESADLRHPPLELLFTKDEETGLSGAKELSPEILRGEYLINLDSEDEGVFTVGCAGGRNTNLRVSPAYADTPADLAWYELSVDGLLGGHSGVDIDKQRANALRLLSRLLFAVRELGPLQLASISGGNAHNAIPRSAKATVGIPSKDVPRFLELLSALREQFEREWGRLEPNLTVSEQAWETPERALTPDFAERLISFLLCVPHGVLRMSSSIDGLVQTSTNLASLSEKDGRFEILTSQRSSLRSELEYASARIQAAASLAGFKADLDSEYPPWEPNMQSPLLALAREVFEKTFGREPVVEVVHAGLECGVIGEKYPGMEILSLGPTIQSPHSPDERLHIPSLERTIEILTALLERLADGQ